MEQCPYTLEQLKAMQAVDVRTVDPATLRDIRDVTVNTDLPKQERILDFMRQIGNPYCYRHGKYVVKISFADTDVTVNCDGREFTVPAGTQVKLTPGESITIYPYMYHDFHVEEGSGDVLLGEVSMCNDDEHDNRFYEPIGRFPAIEEDEAPYRLLCNEYPKA